MSLRLAALVCMSIVLAACARPKQGDPEASRVFSEAATRAAVSKPGARVCRHMQAGISEGDVVRGVVVEAKAEKVAVRIENAGRLPHHIGTIALVPKVVVWDDAASWTPCL